MIGTTLRGARLMGGKTVAHIESLDLLLYDGTRRRVGKTSEASWRNSSLGGRIGAIYAELKRLSR